MVSLIELLLIMVLVKIVFNQTDVRLTCKNVVIINCFTYSSLNWFVGSSYAVRVVRDTHCFENTGESS